MMQIVAIITMAVFATFYAYVLNVSSKPVPPIDETKHRFLWRMRQLYCPNTFMETASRFAMELLICGVLSDVGRLFIDDRATVLLAIPVVRLLAISIIRAAIIHRAQKLYMPEMED